MLNHLPVKGDFARNVVSLMTGTTIAQAIPVAISPILTRLYGPGDFGLLAIFVAITSIMGVMANGRYELAIMLPHDDEDAINIAALGMVIASALSLVLLLIAIFFNHKICQLLGNEAIGIWLYFVPLSVWFTGFFNVLSYYNNRLKNYKDIARVTICKSLVLASLQVGLGCMKLGAIGLISGQIASSLFANGTLFKRTVSKVSIRNFITAQRIKEVSIRYRRFPAYSMPAIVANALSQNLTSILVSAYYSITTLGFYSLVNRVLGMPSALVGGAIGNVFFQRAAEERRKTGKAVDTFDSTIKTLLLIAIPSFLILYFVVEDIFFLVFGESWRVAGEYARILVPLYATRFVVTAVSTLNSVFEKQLLSLAWQLVLLSVSLGLIVYAGMAQVLFKDFLKIFSILGAICYLVLYVLLYMVSRAKL